MLLCCSSSYDKLKMQLFLYKTENQELYCEYDSAFHDTNFICKFDCHNTAPTRTFEQRYRQLRYFHDNTPLVLPREYDVLSLEPNASNFKSLKIEDDVPSLERALQLLHENDANFKLSKSWMSLNAITEMKQLSHPTKISNVLDLPLQKIQLLRISRLI